MTPEERARAWVAHLTAGGTTPWLDFAPEPSAPSADGTIPGAQQLELTRLANLAGAPAPLRRRILAAGLTGRGLQDLPLLGLPPRGYAGRPVDPLTLDPAELSRVAVGVLADQVRRLGPVPSTPPGKRSRGPSYTLAGDPLLCEDARRQLRAAGRRPGGWRARTLVLGDRLDQMLAHAWVERCFISAPPEWPEWVGGLAQDDRLPPRTDLAAVVRRRSQDSRVELVFGSDALSDRLRADLAPPRVPTHETAEVLRRVSVLLGLLDPARRPRLLRSRLLPALPDLGRPFSVAPEHQAWLLRRARGLDTVLDGYPCHGDRRALTAAPERGPDEPDERVLVEVAVTGMVRLATIRGEEVR